MEFFIVREWQDRGVLHLHALVRIARVEAPTPDGLRDAARDASAFSRIDGAQVVWGDRADCQEIRAGADARRRIWYVSKALNYVLKDVATGEDVPPVAVWAHQTRLHEAARRMRCSMSCVPGECTKEVHRRFGSRSHVVSASRRTKNRPGWSFTGLTRTVQRRLRREWFERMSATAADEPATHPVVPVALGERLAASQRRALVTRIAAGP